MYNSHVNLKLPASSSVRIGKAFIQIYFFVVLILFSWISFSIIRFPYGVDYGEAPLMDQSIRIINHQTIYKSDINSPPYIIANYPPLYPLLVGSINSVFNSPLFQTGRLVSIFFSLVCGSVIGLFGYHLTNTKSLGILAAAIFWGNPYVIIWSSLARVDMMALAFSLLGIFILYRRKDSMIWMIIACLCFIVSAFTRQTYLLAGPLAGFVWLFHLNHRRSFLFLLLLGISTLLIFGMINAITQGGFFNNIVVANINKYDLPRTFMMVKQLFVIWPVILISSVVVYILIMRDRNRLQQGFPTNKNLDPYTFFGLGFYSIGAFITALTVGKVGSDVNYFLELIAVCAIWMAIACHIVINGVKSRQWILFGLLFIQLIWVLIGAIPLSNTIIGSRWEKLNFYENLYQRIDQSTHQGVVLSDDYLDMVVLSGQSIYYQPFEYGQLYHAGLWDPAAFSEEVKQGKFPLVIIGGDTLNKDCCWPPSIVNAFEESYQINLDADTLTLIPMR